jgi:formate hydrogenlyase transcriptional activator
MIAAPEIDFMKRVAAQVAVAVDNALNFQAAEAAQKQLSHERDRLQVLLEINNLLVSTRDTNALFRGIVSSLKPALHHDYTSLALLDASSGLLKIHAPIPGNAALPKGIHRSARRSPSGQCFSSRRVLVVRGPRIAIRSTSSSSSLGSGK